MEMRIKKKNVENEWEWLVLLKSIRNVSANCWDFDVSHYVRKQ